MTERRGHEAGIRARLQAALGDAIRSRDAAAVSALRSALAAIANAEAVPPDPAGSPAASSPHVAGAVAGLAAAEAERRLLSESDVEQIVRVEAAERLAAADGCERAGRTDRADRLRREAELLTRGGNPRTPRPGGIAPRSPPAARSDRQNSPALTGGTRWLAPS